MHSKFQEAEQPASETQVRDEASTLIGSSEVFGDILTGIAQEERDAKGSEDDGEVNQPLPSSRPPSTRGTNEVGGEADEEVVIEEGEVNSVRSPDEWVTHILSGLRDPFEACLLDARKESPSPKETSRVAQKKVQ